MFKSIHFDSKGRATTNASKPEVIERLTKIVGAENVILWKKFMNYISDRTTIDENVLGGKPTIRGKRIAVQTILEFLGAGESIKEVLNQYPSLEREDITGCLKFALFC